MASSCLRYVVLNFLQDGHCIQKKKLCSEKRYGKKKVCCAQLLAGRTLYIPKKKGNTENRIRVLWNLGVRDAWGSLWKRCVYVGCVYAWYVCLICMPYMYALYVCLICMSYKHPSSCTTDVPVALHMYALFVCLICMPYMYALYVCLNVCTLTWLSMYSRTLTL